MKGIIDIDLNESIHRATQYLAAASINYLDKKEDDSHTNFGWDVDRKAFITRNLNGNALYLSLNLPSMRLELLRKNNLLASKPLIGARHHEIVDWISQVFRDLSFSSPFKFQFHYELPYSPLTPDYLFEPSDAKELMTLARIRESAYKNLKKIMEDYDENAEIRTWPHHLDTGTLIKLGGDFSIGLGMAIPDTMIDDYYYYVSGWKGHEMISTDSLPKLKQGRWLNNGWKGAILEVSYKSDEEIKEFLTEAIDYLK